MLTQIGNEQWDFVDADGEQISLPPADAPAADIRFPITWRVVTYEPFSGAGGPQLLCTQSGYLVSVKRGPALSLHISMDGGMNWDQGTIIDYHASFNGQILEVEPDVVLVVYPESMGEIRRSFARAQLIRITPDGPLPLKD